MQIVSVLGWLAEAAGTITAGSKAQARHLARQLLDQAAADAFAQDSDVPVSTVIEVGHPASVLCDASGDARMVVVGSRGLGGFTGLLAGSVSIAVAMHARCPVVVVRDQRPSDFQEGCVWPGAVKIRRLNFAVTGVGGRRRHQLGSSRTGPANGYRCQLAHLEGRRH